MTGFDILVFIRSNLRYCFEIMKATVIFEAGTVLDVPITLFDILLGLFISDILFLFFAVPLSSKDYKFTFDSDIFEDDFEE